MYALLGNMSMDHIICTHSTPKCHSHIGSSWSKKIYAQILQQWVVSLICKEPTTNAKSKPASQRKACLQVKSLSVYPNNKKPKQQKRELCNKHEHVGKALNGISWFLDSKPTDGCQETGLLNWHCGWWEWMRERMHREDRHWLMMNPPPPQPGAVSQTDEMLWFFNHLRGRTPFLWLCIQEPGLFFSNMHCLKKPWVLPDFPAHKTLIITSVRS